MSTFNEVKAPAAETYWVPPFQNPDFAFSFTKGGLRYMALERSPQPPFGVLDWPISPSIFSSTDGLTWTHQDPSYAYGAIGDMGPAYDCAFDGTQDTLSCVLDVYRIYSGGIYNYDIRVATYDFATQSWSNPNRSTILTSTVTVNRGLFSSRPDGNFVFITSSSSGVEWHLLVGGGWSITTITGSGVPYSLYVDAANKSHVNVDGVHYVVDAVGSVVTSETASFPKGPLRLTAGALTYPAYSSDFVNFVISRGTPPDTAVWTDDVVGLSGVLYASFRSSAACLTTAAPVDISFEFDSISDHSYNVAGFITDPGSTSLSVYYISHDQTEIKRSTFTGTWSTPVTIFTAVDGKLNNLCASVAGTAVGCRYRIDNR